MDDLISRAELFDELNCRGVPYNAEVNMVINGMPSAQPERKTGRWYKPQGYPRDSYRFICDNCHDVAYFVTGNNGKKNKSDNPKCGYRYCPNCGADMRGEQP